MTVFPGEMYLRTQGLVQVSLQGAPYRYLPNQCPVLWRPFLLPLLSGQHQGNMISPSRMGIYLLVTPTCFWSVLSPPHDPT